MLSALKADASDPRLREFLHAMKPSSKTKVWENTDAALAAATAKALDDVTTEANARVQVRNCFPFCERAFC